MIRIIGDVEGREVDWAVPWYGQVHTISLALSDQYKSYFQRLGERYGPINYIVDVGACIGTMSISYANSFPDAEILALEPSRFNYPYLVHNVRPYPQIKCIKMAAFNESGKVRISNPTEIQRFERNDLSVNTGLIGIHGKSNVFAENVDCDLLDNIVTRKVDYLKIDIEGGEIEALNGALRILGTDRPIIQIEARAENQNMAGRGEGSVHGFMWSNKYASYGAITADWVFIPVERVKHEDFTDASSG